MKIAIQANPNRGKEIISLLESLGGTKTTFSGGGELYTYYIDDNNVIRYNDAPKNYKVYTLEEFEKAFPFRVGDKVIHKEFNDFFEVISFDPESSYPYKIKGVCEFNTKSYVLTKWQPKMKEERFVTITLNKAKEWYCKGGELKEIALQAFSERELNPLPRSWEDYCKNYPIKPEETYVDGYSKFIVNNVGDRNPVHDKNICPSQKSAEAHLALIQLEQLRDCWRQGWEPDWNDDQQTKYCIVHSKEFKIHILYETRRFLSFPTIEMAKEFLECFRDLIEKAGDLI